MLIPDQLHFTLNLHRNIEGKLGQAHGAATVGTPVRAVEFQDEIRESVDDIRLLVEAGRRIDHAEYARPGRDPVKVAKRTVEAAEDGERNQSGGNIALFERDFAPELAERPVGTASPRTETLTRKSCLRSSRANGAPGAMMTTQVPVRGYRSSRESEKYSFGVGTAQSFFVELADTGLG